MGSKVSRKRPKHPLEDAPVLNPAQLGGIETSVLDNGPGRGVRIAWVNTGGGLRYKVVLDRGMDIADAEFLGRSLTFHSLTGTTGPSHAYHTGVEWLRSFYGGLLVSCGPCNTGAPSEDDGESLGLHGTHSNTPALVEFITNPDPVRGRFEMTITGVVRTARMFNPNVELRRTIASTLGESSIRIYDQFLNRGNQTVHHAWLYHINFGFPLLEPLASTYCYKGKLTPRADSVDWFTKRPDYKSAPEPLAEHRGWNEVFTYVDPEVDSGGKVLCGVVNRERKLAVKVEYNKNEFPRLGNWQHWGPGGEYVGALEPMTGGVEGRHVDRQRGWLNHLEPGQTREYTTVLTATNDEKEVGKLLELNAS